MFNLPDQMLPKDGKQHWGQNTPEQGRTGPTSIQLISGVRRFKVKNSLSISLLAGNFGRQKTMVRLKLHTPPGEIRTPPPQVDVKIS